MTSNVICLDTNVLSALFTSEAGSDTLAADLFTRSQTHQLVIHAVVRAELLAHPQMSPALLTKNLSVIGVALDEATPTILWDQAGLAFRNYAARRRQSGGQHPRRFLADFLIGAHAQHLEATLYTLDPQHYRLSFAELPLLP